MLSEMKKIMERLIKQDKKISKEHGQKKTQEKMAQVKAEFKDAAKTFIKDICKIPAGDRSFLWAGPEIWQQAVKEAREEMREAAKAKIKV